MNEVFFSLILLRGLICGWKPTIKTKISCSFFLWWRWFWAAVVCLSCMFRILVLSFCNGQVRGFDAHYMLCFFCFFSWCHNECPTRFHEKERCCSGGKQVCHNATLVCLSFLGITDVKMMFSQVLMISSLSFSAVIYQICRMAQISETLASLQPSEKLLPRQKREKPHHQGTSRQTLPKHGMKQVTSRKWLMNDFNGL